MSAGYLPTWPRIEFLTAFSHGADAATFNAAAVGWLDLGSRLRGPWSSDVSGRQYELDQVQSGALNATLENKDRLLDPTNTASPLWPNVRPMRPCRLQAIWPPSQNIAPAGPAAGTSVRFFPTVGTVASATGLAAAPPGHTVAGSWAVPGGTAAGAQCIYGLGALSAIDRFAPTVTAGRPYTVSAYLSRPLAGGDTTVQAAVGLAWYAYDESYISSSTGTAVTVPRQGTWIRATATATAPAGAVWCRPFEVTAGSATVATNTIYATAWQIEQASAATTWASPGTLYPLWAGYVERWPMTWDYSGTYDLMQITCVDALAALAATTLDASLRAQLTAFNPSRMYPLDEPQDSAYFFDATGLNPPAQLAQSISGPGTVTAGATVEGGGSYGNPGPVLSLDQPTPGTGIDTACSFLVLDPPGPPAAGGFTRIICFRTTVTPPVQMSLWAAVGPGSFGAGGSQARAAMYVWNDGHFIFGLTSASGTVTSQTTAGVVTDGNWHLATMSVDAAGTSLRWSLDGTVYATTVPLSVYPTGCSADLIGVTATYPTGGALWAFSGDVAFAAEIPAVLSVQQLNDLGKGFATGWANEPAANRQARILDLAGYTGLRSHGAAFATMGGFPSAGSDAMSALQVVADSDNGQVVADRSGTVVMFGRAWRYLQPEPTIVFGEDAAGNEIPYAGDFAVDDDPTHIYNSVTVENTGAGGVHSTTTVSATDVASRIEYLPRPLSRSTNLNSDIVASDLAAGLLYTHKDAHPRVSTLTVDPSQNPTVLPALLATSFGNRVRVIRRPAVGAPIVLEQWLEHLSWSGDGSSGRLQWRGQLSPAPPVDTPWAVATSAHTTLAASASIGATTITLAALDDAAVNPAAAVLPAGTTLRVGYLAASSEDAVVASVASTSPGYSTVVVTLAAPLTKAHASGEVVAQPQGPALALPGASVLDFDPAGTITTTGPLATF